MLTRLALPSRAFRSGDHPSLRPNRPRGGKSSLSVQGQQGGVHPVRRGLSPRLMVGGGTCLRAAGAQSKAKASRW